MAKYKGIGGFRLMRQKRIWIVVADGDEIKFQKKASPCWHPPSSYGPFPTPASSRGRRYVSGWDAD